MVAKRRPKLTLPDGFTPSQMGLRNMSNVRCGDGPANRPQGSCNHLFTPHEWFAESHQPQDGPPAYLRLVAGLVPKEIAAEVDAKVTFTMNFGKE